MESLRQLVLDYNHMVLPVPWDIIEERDYAAETAMQPLLPFAEGEPVISKLGTERELSGHSANVVILTAKLKGEQRSLAPGGMQRTGGEVAQEILHLNGVVNPPAALTLLQWQKIRWAALEKEIGKYLEFAPNKIMIIHSYGDMLSGGCTESAMLERYNQIINASGGTQTIVAAGEVSPYPWSLGWRYSRASWVLDRQATVLSGSGVPTDWVSAHANCTDRASGPCNSPPSYQYLNSGFLMGPVGDLSAMLSEMACAANPQEFRTTSSFTSELSLDESTLTAGQPCDSEASPMVTPRRVQRLGKWQKYRRQRKEMLVASAALVLSGP